MLSAYPFCRRSAAKRCASAAAKVGAPYFEQAQLVLVCRKLYADDLRPEKFTDQSLDGRWYPEHDYHRMYVGEVVQVLKK